MTAFLTFDGLLAPRAVEPAAASAPYPDAAATPSSRAEP